jgi:hypothetical protein
MKLVPTSTTGVFAKVDDEDFDKVMQAGPWHIRVSHGVEYVNHSFWDEGSSHSIQLHRFILGVTDSTILVDHWNHDGLDNQKDNLRLATLSQNGGNRVLNKNSTTGFKGVRKHNGKYEARIVNQHGKRISLGHFADPVTAALVYGAAATKKYGEFALCNILSDVTCATVPA